MECSYTGRHVPPASFALHHEQLSSLNSEGHQNQHRRTQGESKEEATPALRPGFSCVERERNAPARRPLRPGTPPASANSSYSLAAATFGSRGHFRFEVHRNCDVERCTSIQMTDYHPT